MADQFDLIIIGGGILGLSAALEVAHQYPKIKLGVLEKEARLAAHQTGHNSGVIHSGIYYKPGSLKAKTCVTGGKLLTDFCDQYDIPYERCGKVVVATSEDELPRLEELHRRGTANGVEGLEMIGPERLRELEPHAAGIRALHVPVTGIIDYVRVAEQYAALVQEAGGEIRCAQSVQQIVSTDGHLVLETAKGAVHTQAVINCGGLQCDRLAQMAGAKPELQIVPFRGEYYMIAPEKHYLVKNLIYPVPDPAFPFLGVHFTRTMDGEMEAGPNAVLAFAREGYQWADMVPRELWETLCFPGFRTIARKYWQTGLGEIYRSLSKSAFLRALQRLLPELQEKDLLPGGSGVRAQAISADGALVDDFVITSSPHAIHVLNAPSPGATASLAIGQQIVKQAAQAFSWQA